MNIEIRHARPKRVWHRRLAEALRANGHVVRFVVGQGRGRLPFSVRSALAMQRRLFGPSLSLFDTIGVAASDAFDTTDAVIALDGVRTETTPAIEPLFNGRVGEAALVDMLAADGDPLVRVCVHYASGTADTVSALLAVEHRDILVRALDQVLARVVSLIAQAVDRTGETSYNATDAAAASRLPSNPLTHMVCGTMGKVGARAGPPHWRIGVRSAVTDRAMPHDWSADSFTILADDGKRFYADPFPFEHDGKRYVFFEDFPYATGKGVIGVVEIDADGRATPPRTVLEQPFHLSYPLVLAHEGRIYMLPEMGAAGRIQLFRADLFPDRWVADRVLIEGCVAADATPIQHEGRWWLFATLADDGGSTWDALGLFHAPDLLGPWTPHPGNPVLVDASAARPAGAMWHENGVLMRVAQDCRGGYGRGLTICRVDRLDTQGYAQTVVARRAPPEGSQADGIHTINRSASLEVIDLRFPHASGFDATGPLR